MHALFCVSIPCTYCYHNNAAVRRHPFAVAQLSQIARVNVSTILHAVCRRSFALWRQNKIIIFAHARHICHPVSRRLYLWMICVDSDRADLDLAQANDITSWSIAILTSSWKYLSTTFFFLHQWIALFHDCRFFRRRFSLTVARCVRANVQMYTNENWFT